MRRNGKRRMGLELVERGGMANIRAIAEALAAQIRAGEGRR